MLTYIHNNSRRTRAALAPVITLLVASGVQAESMISLSTGTAYTYDSDVTYSFPNQTDLRFEDVKWDTKPLDAPPYWTARYTYWLNSSPEWGWALDFTHAKMISDPDKQVRVSGTRQGLPVNGTEAVGATFDTLEFSDGHNLFTINGMRRWQLQPEDTASKLAGSAFYLGAGVGIAVPHAEVVTADTNTMGYQYAGPAVQGIAGFSFPLSKRFVLLTEYRLTYADMEVDLDGGGSLSTDALTHHLNIGIGFKW